jgi:glycosyltransferase involved in cell wall biosynthesis
VTAPGARPIRVLQVLWRLSRGGGAPVVVRGLLEHIDRDEFDAHVCTIRPVDPDDRVDELGDHVTYHPLGLTGRATPRLRARALLGVARTVRAVKPDVLHVHSGTAWYALPAALLTRRAAKLIEVHDAPQSARLSRVNLRVERVMSRHAGFHPLVHSRAVRDGVASAWDMAPDTIPIVPLGIDTEALTRPAQGRAEVRAELGLPADGPLVLYVARLVPEKRPELFVEVAARVRRGRPDAVFAIVGSGSQLAPLREAVRDAGLDRVVSVPGFVDDLASAYHAADLFLPTSRYEGFGLAIAEAMASGLPVLSTLVGGVEDVIGDAGVLEASADPERLALAVTTLLDEPHRRRRLGDQAQQRARDELDVRVTARGFEDAYRRACGR